MTQLRGIAATDHWTCFIFWIEPTTRDQYRYLSRVNGVNTAALGMSAQNGDISQFAVAKTVWGIFQLGEVGSAKPVKI